MIKTENIVYTYNKGLPNAKRVLNGVSIHIEKNMTTAIIGRTGSGKSTLLRHLNGLLVPDEGRVTVGGTDINTRGVSMRDVRRRVGVVFQYPEYQLFEETVYKDIAFAPKNMGLDEEEIRRRVNEAMETVRLPKKYASRSPFELSGGEKRRAAIAGIIAMKPSVLVLDEPAAGLDPRGRNEILSVISDWRTKNAGSAVVLVSHSMEDVARAADKIYALDQGRVRLEGTPAEVFAHADELCEMGLDVPALARLGADMRKRGIPLRRDIYAADDAAREIISIFRSSGKLG